MRVSLSSQWMREGLEGCRSAEFCACLENCCTREAPMHGATNGTQRMVKPWHLLVPECSDRIDPGGSTRRDVARENAHDHQEDGDKSQGARIGSASSVEQPGENAQGKDTGQYAGNSPCQRQLQS